MHFTVLPGADLINTTKIQLGNQSLNKVLVVTNSNKARGFTGAAGWGQPGGESCVCEKNFISIQLR